MMRVMKNPHSELKTMDEMTVILRRFGDEESTLYDQYERLSFEVQLNQAILGRSLSEPSTVARTRTLLPVAPPPLPGAAQVSQGRRPRKMGFQKVLKKLLKPILGGRVARKDVRNEDRDHKLWKKFSRSLRL